MRTIKTGILLFLFLSITTGVIYPGVVTIISRLAFPHQAGGSLIHRADGTAVGSSLVGQPFSDPKYFWPRPSATSGFPYNPQASGGANLGPTNKDFLKQVADRVKSWQDTGISGPIPPDLVLASGSGLDPHLSLEGAALQIPRVARARGFDEMRVHRLVQEQAEGRQLGFLGAPRVNVVKLNLSLDNLR